ncbi:MAG TPA: protein kinase, partial [Pyrinomonadaceae bacterium]|nr:protein kinase [Pyrinomonadaceae bacterium]
SSAKREIASSLEKELPLNGDDPMLGKRIGVFRLTRELGRGGMGAVYLAERADGEFRQKVAVKLIKRGMDTDFIIRRFRHERQILAALDHPNIARLMDGGTTDDGLPYFVMEFIEGEPLHRYCDARRLSIRQRLQLFKQICSAVAYAHEHQIVHRDIKPGNILVPPSGVPKLLDFGIAKILDPDLIHESINPTSTMMRLMTPEYASPEQVRGLPVTPSSDVYALGVLLYELVTGHRPYSFEGRSPHEISRVICESDPALPSQSVVQSENLLPSYVSNQIKWERSAEMRGAKPELLQQELNGNLDNIILKSLCKEPEGRYSSVKEFSDDIARYLDGESVSAEACAVTVSGQFDKAFSDSTPTGSRSIAVLPFKMLHLIADENTGDRFLGLGLADALITRLSNIRRFIVRPTSSVLRYGEGQFDPFGAGKELSVEFILDGHIQRAGARIRVSVQLLNVAEKTTVWAERFDENFTDVLSLEDAISTKVAEALIPRLTIDERQHLLKRGTDNAEAFESYLRGRYHWNSFTEEGFAKAIVAYNQAIALDPNYALAYTGVADYYIWLGIYGVLPPHECFLAAKEAASKSVELDPQLSEAHAS